MKGQGADLGIQVGAIMARISNNCLEGETECHFLSGSGLGFRTPCAPDGVETWSESGERMDMILSPFFTRMSELARDIFLKIKGLFGAFVGRDCAWGKRSALRPF